MARTRCIRFSESCTAFVAGKTSPQAITLHSVEPDTERIRILLKKHDDALSNHDLEGVMACLAKNAVVVDSNGVWRSSDEIKSEYKRLFLHHDKSQQNFEYSFKIGGLTSDMGWLVLSGTVNGKKDAVDFSYPLHVSLTVQKIDGTWRIAGVHFSPRQPADLASAVLDEFAV